MFKRLTLVGILTFFICSCNLFFSTKISFLNSTTSYIFTEIKFGPIDYATPLPPGQGISYIPIDPGSYTLFTRGVDGILYQWPVPQPVERGYSYTLTFTTQNSQIVYDVYIAMVR